MKKHGKYSRIVFAFFIIIGMVTGLILPVSAAGIPGDVKPDGIVNVSDARLTLRMIYGLDGSTDSMKKAADVNMDKRINAHDVILILQYAVGIRPADDAGADGFGSATWVGLTDKLYKIYDKNGVTYIDGQIIANKSFSLPQGYAPGELIPACQSAFDEMTAAAQADGLSLWVQSGFRSYETQSRLYENYAAEDGYAGADTYSARPGHSEHQTGLAIDVNSVYASFADTPEGKWLASNCWQYGFILRYPQNKTEQTGYMYESWHIRYVGKELAARIMRSGLCLEEYYGISSEYKS